MSCCYRRCARELVAALLFASGAISAVQAAPPTYLIVRRPESPGPHFRPGIADAAAYEVPASGYAYGWFGATPRSHASRHFGYYRTYTQWSKW